MTELHSRPENAPTRISVAMATFNGASFLRKQLESLAAQLGLPFELVVCDDGSTDSTISILQDFAQTSPFPVRIYQNGSKLGFADNFFKAARLCKGDWISFCDQDDVWLPKRLSECVQAIEKNRRAILILQNAYLSDANLETRGRVFPNAIKAGSYKRAAQYGLWVWPGFLQTVRTDLIIGIPNFRRPISYFPGHDVQPHDKWTCMIANAIGEIIVLGEPVALYRRHANALTGDYALVTGRQALFKARSVSFQNYTYAAVAARSTAAYLRDVANECNRTAWRLNLLLAAQSFEQISTIQELRASLYATDKTFLRVKILMEIIGKGGYWGRRFTAMGHMSAVKDLFVTLGFLRLRSETVAS